LSNINQFGGKSSLYSGVVIPQFEQNKAKTVTNVEDTESKEVAAEVELLRMVSPSGNEVIFSLSKEVMGRSLSHKDYKVPGVSPAPHSALCQKTISQAVELQRAELKLELELMIEELGHTKTPRFLTETQQHILSQVPLCEEFQLQLTAINKMIEGYSYTEMAMTQVK
jgi:hypothetical protein